MDLFFRGIKGPKSNGSVALRQLALHHGRIIQVSHVESSSALQLVHRLGLSLFSVVMSASFILYYVAH